MRSQIQGNNIIRITRKRGGYKGVMKAPRTYDSKLIRSLERLRREIDAIKKRMNLYNVPVSKDNFL